MHATGLEKGSPMRHSIYLTKENERLLEVLQQETGMTVNELVVDSLAKHAVSLGIMYLPPRPADWVRAS